MLLTTAVFVQRVFCISLCTRWGAPSFLLKIVAASIVIGFQAIAWRRDHHDIALCLFWSHLKPCGLLFYVALVVPQCILFALSTWQQLAMYSTCQDISAVQLKYVHQTLKRLPLLCLMQPQDLIVSVNEDLSLFASRPGVVSGGVLPLRLAERRRAQSHLSPSKLTSSAARKVWML